MRRFLLLVILLAVVGFITIDRQLAEAQAQPKPARRALLIGVSKYDSPQFPSLEFPKNDVARFGELLESPQYGFNVTRLNDDSALKPTRKNILDTMRRVLVDESKEGDIVVFYFSGHGSSVANSLSDESDLRDETIVPSDAVRPVRSMQEFRDIRDKEIAELFNRALDKKIKLTAIFDSCHSGSIARGEEQPKEVDGVEFDIKSKPTDIQRIKPEERGALILTAAEDYQQASGGNYELNGIAGRYSHFTAELIRSLYEAPADRQTTRDLFRRVSSRLVAAGRSQTPTIAGIASRFDESLFGDDVAFDARTRASMTIVDNDGKKKMLLAAGIADGLADGVIMRRVMRSTFKETDPPLHIRITKAGLSVSEFELVDNTGKALASTDWNVPKTDDYFEQITWASKREPDLTVWVPPAWESTKQLMEETRALKQSLSKVPFQLTNESAAPGRQYLMFADRTNGKTDWKLRSPLGKVISLGEKPSADALSRLLTQTRGSSPKIFLDVAPSSGIRSSITSAVSANGNIAVVDDPSAAQYRLVGRLNEISGNIEYCWVLGAAMQPAIEKENVKPVLSLPASTEWVSGDEKANAASLAQLASRLSKIRTWLALASPIKPGSPEFPYRLEIRPRKPSATRSRSLEAGDTMYAGSEYDIVLAAPKALLADSSRMLREFWVYILEIDSDGNGTYLDSTGSSERYGGMRSFDLLDPPKEIPLIPPDGTPLTVNPPFGTETFILLVTDRPIDRGALSFSGVRGQVQSTKGDPTTLESLLSTVGLDSQSRGTLNSPETWAVQKLVLRSSAAVQ